MVLAVKVKKQLATLAAEKVTREEFWENGSKVGGARVWCFGSLLHKTFRRT